ncbi:hypothetical protein [Streptomyces sp. MAR4 CNX-425]
MRTADPEQHARNRARVPAAVDDGRDPRGHAAELREVTAWPTGR